MACEFIAPPQTVALNGPILFNDSIPCSQNRIYHDDGNGTFQLRGMRRGCACCCNCGRCNNNTLTEYQVTFIGNVAIPTGGTVGPIAVALTIGGEPIGSSRAIVTPAAVEDYFNVTATKIVKIPWGCCPSLSVEYVNGSVDDPTFVPTPTISVVDGNLTITPVNE